MLEIDENIHPCKGCPDYNPLDSKQGCRSNGGCGRKQSNADRIRSKSDEELAAWLRVVADCEGCPAVESFDECRHGKDCEDKWLKWLRKEAT